MVRALEDAPGGRIFFGERRSTPVADTKKAATDFGGSLDEKISEIVTTQPV